MNVEIPDPRLQPLVDLVQQMLQKYIALATSLAEKLPPETQDDMTLVVRDVVTNATTRLSEIVATGQRLEALYLSEPFDEQIGPT